MKIMIKQILFIATLIILNTSVLYAEEKLATVLRGKIIAHNLSDVEVVIKESDGSILDMTDISAAGIFNLDLTIMDRPSLSEVRKLIVEVKNKSGTKKKFAVSQYMNVFDDTVLLKPIEFK